MYTVANPVQMGYYLQTLDATGDVDGSPELLSDTEYWKLYQTRIDYEGDRPVFAVIDLLFLIL